MTKRLMILLSASQRRSSNPEQIPALERYQGIYFKVAKKYLREGRLRNTDIIIVSDKLDIIRQDVSEPYHSPLAMCISTTTSTPT